MSTHSPLQTNYISPPSSKTAESGILQRKCACGTHTVAGDKCDECKAKEGALQRKSSGGSNQFEAPPIVHKVLNSAGQPLDKSTKAFFEPRFAHSFSKVPVSSAPTQVSQSGLTVGASTDVFEQEADRIAESVMLSGQSETKTLATDEAQTAKFDLSRVRIHTDAQAAKSADMVNALAYTVGNNIVFGAGQFAPATPPGQRLIAHELAHVAQQQTRGRSSVQRFGLALDYKDLAARIQKAIDGPGTDEEAIYDALSKLQRDADSVAELEATYRQLFSESLTDALDGDLNKREMDFAKGLMGKSVDAKSSQKIETTTPATDNDWDTQARRIQKAANFRTWGIFWGTDEEAIFAVLQPLAGDPNKIEAIKKAYARITKGSSTALVDEIKDEMSGTQLSYALNLLNEPLDPHKDTQAELSRDQALGVRNTLQPGTAVKAPTPPPVTGPPVALPPPAEWDGRLSHPDHVKNRAALKSDLDADLIKHLNCVMPDMRTVAAFDKLPIPSLEGAANAAVEITDDEYQSWYGVAATTPSQSALRSGFKFSQASGTLLDATDPAARALVGNPLSADAVANWMARNNTPQTTTCPSGVTPGVFEHMNAHNFDPDSSTNGEKDWLQNEVINPFIAPAARNADLMLFDQFGFSLQPEPGKLVMLTSIQGSSLAKGGAPNAADRARLWSVWHTAVHEYIHNLAHPAFQRSALFASSFEGFTEYFKKAVILKVAPIAHLNKGLVSQVEGGIFKPETTPAMVGSYTTPMHYKTVLARVESLAASVPGKDNALRAAYFQGHTEMLGIDPATRRFAAAAPGTVDPNMVSVPAGISTLDDLAMRSGVSKSEILKANTGLTDGAALPATLKLPGVREHKIVTTFLPNGAAGPAETVDQIAAQNGVSVEALKQANPNVNWGSLAGNQNVLIPKH